MNPLHRVVPLAFLFAVVAAACSTISLPAPSELDADSSNNATTTTDPPDPADLSDRFGVLVAMAADGSIDAMWVDGSLSQEIAAPDETRTAPTWSPYNNLLYWGRSLGGGNRVIETVSPDAGRILASVDVDSLPFYIAPSPTIREVAYLGSGRESGIVLGLPDLTPGGSDQIIGSGEPFYFSFSPDGTRIAQHIGDGPVSVLPTSELITTPLDTVGSADWTVPYWIDSQTVLAVHHDTADPTIRSLATFDIVTGERTDIVQFGGQLLFVPSPDRQTIAVQSTEQAAGGEPAVRFTSFQDNEPNQPNPLLALPAIPPNELVVVDVATAEITPTDLGQSLAFTWSPVEDKLATLTPGGNGLIWSFWSNGLIGESPIYQPSALSLGTYIPFFTQFAETSRWWAPDGRAFVFAGTVGDETGVWVQPVNLGAFPTLVNDGDYGFFAP